MSAATNDRSALAGATSRERLGELWATLSGREQRRLLWSAVAAAVLGLFELVGVALLLPIVSLLLDPTQDSALIDLGRSVTGLEDPSALAGILALVVAVCFVAKAVLTLVYHWWNAGFVAQLEADVASRLVRRFLQTPYRFHLDHTSAEMVRDVRDGATLAVGTSMSAVLSLFAEVASAAALLMVLVLVSPAVTVALALYLGGALWLYQRIVRRRSYETAHAYYEGQQEVFDQLLHAFGGAKEIYARDRQAHFADRLAESRDGLARSVRRQGFYGLAPRYVLEILSLVGTSLAALALVVANGADAALPMIAVFVGAGFRMAANAGRLMLGVHQIRMGLPAIDAVVAAEHLEVAPVDRPASLTARPGKPVDEGLVSFHDVGFAYRAGGAPVLAHVSFQIPAGGSFGIVGSSGAGKTTALDLLLGLLEPTSGRVLAGGVDVADCGRAWRSLVGYVAQDVFLLDGSIRDNVAFGIAPEAVDDSLVAEAVAAAELADWIGRLPDGLDTPVGERGARLSGGQRQRVGLARALYGRPRVLVLDEATASLDVETEDRIAATVAKMSDHLTVVIVAHRLSTVRRCDRVCLLAGGRVAGIGTFAELQHSNESFARMAALAGFELDVPVDVR